MKIVNVGIYVKDIENVKAFFEQYFDAKVDAVLNDEKNDYYSGRGVFTQRDFSILRIESCDESWMDQCPKELIRFSQLIKGGISAAEFLEEYSNGKIH